LDRVFLDANVLFSAAYATGSCFLNLWKRKGIRLLTSEYAVQEASRNLAGVERLKRLKWLVETMEIVSGHTVHFPLDVPVGVNLPEKDQPIMAAAINGRATHLLTGDRRHFGKCFGKRIRGVLIQTPAQYLGHKLRPSRGE
jgi:predicted nucleic acid-binding protein